MTEDLTTPANVKYDSDTKKFLKEASALIELVNLVDSYRLRKTKVSECCLGKMHEYHEPLEPHRHRKNCGSHKRLRANNRERPKPTTQRDLSQSYKSSLSNSAALRFKTKPIKSKHKTLELKKESKCQLEILKPKISKGTKLEVLKQKINKDISRDTKIHSQKRSSPRKVRNASTRTVEREIRRRLLKSNIDITSVRIQSLRDLLGLNENRKNGRPIDLLPKTHSSKQCSRNRKRNLSDSFVLNKKITNQNVEKQNNSHGHSIKTVKEPSLHLTLNLHLKPNSNKIKMQIQSKRSTPTSCPTNEPKVLSIRLPYVSDSAAHQERINKMLKNKHSRKLSTSSNKRETKHSSNDRIIMHHNIRCSKVRMPYHKTQAVYNVYDVVPYQQPRKVQGIKSHISFNLNFGNPPRTEQTYTDETGSINTQHGTYVGKPCEVRYKNKVNYNSGMTSLQQSLSLGRRNPQSETYYPSDSGTQPCDCELIECEPNESDDQQACDTCCQAPINVPEPKQPVNVLENCLTIFKRTKRRIVNRVTNVSREASSIVLSPRAFMKRIYDRYAAINNRVEQRLKDEGSCTCSPFLDTDQVSVYEENVDPECSFLKRCFGSLLYNDKCIVCSREKGVGTGRRLFKPYECAPGVCVEAGGFLSCLTKYCDKYKKGKQTKKDAKAKTKAKKAKDKAKAKKDLAKKKARDAKKKAKAKKKKKGSPVCRFLTSIFKKPKDEDKRKLLKKGKKGRKHKGGDDDTKGGRAGETGVERHARRGLRTGRRHFRRATKRIREKYYRNKKLAEEQKGRFACDFYLLSLRNRPCLWVYYMCPWCYPHCLQALNLWRQISDLLLFFVAIVVWSPCILATELLKVMACNLCV